MSISDAGLQCIVIKIQLKVTYLSVKTSNSAGLVWLQSYAKLTRQLNYRGGDCMSDSKSLTLAIVCQTNSSQMFHQLGKSPLVMYEAFGKLNSALFRPARASPYPGNVRSPVIRARRRSRSLRRRPAARPRGWRTWAEASAPAAAAWTRCRSCWRPSTPWWTAGRAAWPSWRAALPSRWSERSASGENTPAAQLQPSALSATDAGETKQGFVHVIKVTRKRFLPQRISPL